MSIPYTVISTGSKGNAVIINEAILVDCGVPYKLIQPYASKLKIVLLTHIHGDHFRASTVRALSRERPTLRFACCSWMASPLAGAGVPAKNIDILQPNTMYGYGICNIIPVLLVHNVPNCGYKLHFPIGKVFYATDTNNLNGITARHYDLYMVEANYEDEVILQKIEAKKEAGEFAYEVFAMQNHLSRAKCDDFIYKNIGPGGEYVYLHCHVDDEEQEETS